jgi:cell division protein FtsI/penicillin-binding protein 2
MNSKQKFRARTVLLLFIILALFIVFDLYSKQIINGSNYLAKANKQYVKPTSTIFNRGNIFFESKDKTKISVATVDSGYLLYMNPKLIKDKNIAYEAVSHYVTPSKEDFMEKASKSNDVYEELLHRLNDKQAEGIKSLGIAGIGVQRETWRSYPGGKLASKVVGIVGQSKSSGIEGRYGLERYYESVLMRQGINNDSGAFASLFSGLKNTVFGDIENQGSIVSSIEPTVEKYVEKIMGETFNTWNPDEIGVIIMNPHNGEIVSMTSLPTFDANNTSNVKDVSIFSNPLVEHVYEMGSIMKPLTVAVGLDSKAINMAWKYDDTGTMTLSNKKISNYDGKARGITPLQQVLSQSLNVGTANIALKIGKDDFSKYFKSFGLGEKTGIDQPNESAGIVKNLNTGRDVEIATAGYGQGIAISPIAMVRALSVLANDGYLVNPHIVKEIVYENGTTKKVEQGKGIKVLDKETTDNVTKMLVEVVDQALKKGAIKNEHYSMAAKTGTAQIPDPVNRGYYSDRYLHSFFGYFPAYNPQFIIFLYQIHPKGAEYASETLTEPFSDMAKFLIDYYNIPPDR